MTARARFTQADVRRAVDAVKACGIAPSGVKIGQDGSITVLITYGLPANDATNPLDRLHHG